MGVFPSCLFAFVLCVRASSAGVDSWTAEIQKSVEGLSGSFVEIPCKFNYPSDGKTYKEFTGIWYKDSSDVIYHKETSKIIDKFKNRTTLLGDLHHKNCTLKINSLLDSDTGSYMFRIEIKNFNNYSYNKNKVSITVNDSPEQPTILMKDEVMSQNNSGQQKIKVLYPPEIKNESSCKSELLTVCVCTVDSNPPSEVKWFGPSGAFPSSSTEQNGFLTIFTLQGWLGFPDAVNCSATNSEGNDVITIQVPHNGMMMIIYIVVATAAVLVTLVIISVYVAKRHCRRRAQEQHLMALKADPNEIKTTPKSGLVSKEEKGNDIYANNQDDSNVYKNWGCGDRDLPCGQDEDEDEAVYANTQK